MSFEDVTRRREETRLTERSWRVSFLLRSEMIRSSSSSWSSRSHSWKDSNA